MKFYAIAAAAATLLGQAIAGDVPANIKAGVDNPQRKEENRASDEGRKPGEVLAFYKVREGMTVADLAAGGGYFTEILSGAVGADGKVIAHYPGGDQFESIKATLEAQFAPFGNIELTSSPTGEPFPIADNSVDIALLSLIAHHLHYDEASGEAIPERSSRIYGEIYRILKPGGVFAVIEHTAAPGSTRAESAAWHRAPEEILKADIASAGFVFDGSSDIHKNPDDDMKNNFFESGMRGKTTRMVHKYRKPE